MRVQKWMKIKSQLEKKYLTQEVQDILTQLVNLKTTYSEIDDYLSRIEFLIPTLSSGETKISNQISYRILEIDHNYLEFVQLANKYKVPLNDNLYWKNRGFENMEDYFLYKDYYIIPSYKLHKPNQLFWKLIQTASEIRKPNMIWLQLIKPYIYNVDFMNELKSIYQNLTNQMKKRNPNLSKQEIDQILYLGEDFTIRFIQKGEEVPIALPDNEIIDFEGILLNEKDKYQQVYAIQRLIDQGLSPSMISNMDKTKLFYRL